MPKKFTVIVAILVLALILTITDCTLSSVPDPADGQKIGSGTEIQAPAPVLENDSKSKTNADFANHSAIEYISDIAGISLIYPQNKVFLSSSKYISNPNHKLNLVIEENKLENIIDKSKAREEKESLQQEEFSLVDQLAFQPSKKIYEKGQIKIKEYIIFSKGNPYLTAFERKAIFFTKGCRVEIVLSLPAEPITDSMENYFAYDTSGQSSVPKWDTGQQQNLYQDLVRGQAPRPVQEWYDTFDALIDSLQLDGQDKNSTGYSQVVGKTLYEQHSPYPYQVTVFYPQLLPLTFPQAPVNDVIVNDILEMAIGDFKSIINQNQELGTDGSTLGNSLSVDYSLLEFNPVFTSILFYVYHYTGGAHGMQYFDTINYSFHDNRIFGLDDLFRPGFDYLKFLSDYCFEDLKIQMQMDEQNFLPEISWIKEGSAPIRENYSNILITKEAIIVKFLPYQVASYAAGEFTVSIPYSQFEEHIDKKGIASHIFTGNSY